jgi:mRNA interferase MazF
MVNARRRRSLARFVAGDVVVVPFPFSDLSQAKRRPALVVATPQSDDLILCQITTQTKRDAYVISLEPQDFVSGQLKHNSFVRPNKLFTLNQNIILYAVGRLHESKLEAIQTVLVSLFKKA